MYSSHLSIDDITVVVVFHRTFISKGSGINFLSVFFPIELQVSV